MMRDTSLDVAGTAKWGHHDGVVWCGDLKCLNYLECALDDKWWAGGKVWGDLGVVVGGFIGGLGRRMSRDGEVRLEDVGGAGGIASGYGLWSERES
jgi:hypothetical protein